MIGTSPPPMRGGSSFPESSLDRPSRRILQRFCNLPNVCLVFER
jgi:hypothetical protein